MAFLRKVLVTSLAAKCAIAQLASQHINEEFRSSVSAATDVYFPDDADWANGTVQRWTIYEPTRPVYAAAIKPASAEDVATIVKIANKYNISYLATGGGHGLSVTLGQLDEGINIDLGYFNSVDLDLEAETVSVGGAATFGAVIPVVYAAGYEVVTGSCPCVGAVGATIGGGLSRLQGFHGLIVDNVVSFRVVTAKGKIITASNEENSDLFWALLGAGHNFAIILEVKFRIYPATNAGKALNADMLFPASANETHWELLSDISGNVPKELSLVTGIQHDPIYGLTIFLNAVYYGPEHLGRELLKPFLENGPRVTNITVINAADVANSALFGATSENGPTCAKGQYLNTYTLGLKDMDIPTFQALFNDMAVFYEDYPSARSSLAQFEFLSNEGVKAVPPGTNAYPDSHRQINTQTLWFYNYNDPSIEAAVTTFAQRQRNDFLVTSGFTQMQLYSSYAHGDEGPEVWYRESLPRLRELKKKFDPLNRFRFFNPVKA